MLRSVACQSVVKYMAALGRYRRLRRAALLSWFFTDLVAAVPAIASQTCGAARQLRRAIP